MSASGSGAAAALGTAITVAGLDEALHGTAPGIRSSGRMAVSGKRTADHTNREPSSIRMTASAMASETEGFDRGGLAERGERGPTVVADTHNADRAGLSATLKSGAPADEDGPVPRGPTKLELFKFCYEMWEHKKGINVKGAWGCYLPPGHAGDHVLVTSRLRNNRGRTRTLEDECTQSVKVDFGGEQPPQQSSSTVLEVPAVASPVEGDPVSCSSAPCDTMPISLTTASLNSAAPVPVPIAELAPRDNVAPRPPAWLQNKMMTSGVEEPEPTEWSEMVAAVVQMGKSATTTLREWLIEQGATQAGAFTDKGVTHVFTDSTVKADGIVAKLDLLKRCVKVVIVVPEGTKPGSTSRAQEKRPRKKEQQKSEDRGNGACMLPALNGHTRPLCHTQRERPCAVTPLCDPLTGPKPDLQGQLGRKRARPSHVPPLSEAAPDPNDEGAGRLSLQSLATGLSRTRRYYEYL